MRERSPPRLFATVLPGKLGAGTEGPGTAKMSLAVVFVLGTGLYEGEKAVYQQLGGVFQPFDEKHDFANVQSRICTNPTLGISVIKDPVEG